MAENVEISKNTLGCLVGGLIASLMVTAFLFGRQTGTTDTLNRQSTQAAVASAAPTTSDDKPDRQSLNVSSAPNPVSDPAPPQPVVQPVSQTYVTHQTFAAPPTVTAPIETKPVELQPTASRLPAAAKHVQTAPKVQAPVPPPVATQQGPSEEVADYFKQIDALSLGLGAGSNATEFATDLLQQSLNGDQHGFDELLNSARKNLTAVQAIHPPASCAEHHRLVARQLNQSIAMLTKVKTAMVSMDTSTLTSLSTEGRGMQKEAEMIEKLEKRLRRSQ